MLFPIHLLQQKCEASVSSLDKYLLGQSVIASFLHLKHFLSETKGHIDNFRHYIQNKNGMHSMNWQEKDKHKTKMVAEAKRRYKTHLLLIIKTHLLALLRGNRLMDQGEGLRE